MSVSATSPNVGLIGAGRLGQAFGAAAKSSLGHAVCVWSRRFETSVETESVEPAGAGLTVTDLGGVMRKPIVVSAISNRALLEVSSKNTSLFKQFSGLIILTGADTPDQATQHALSSALVVRAVPILLPGKDGIVSLVLMPEDRDTRWTNALAWLNSLGETVCVEDPDTFDEVKILTSPLAAVVRTALTNALMRYLDERSGHKSLQRSGFDAASLALTGRVGTLGEACLKHDARIATPGGLTEAGLEMADSLSSTLLAVMKAIKYRADEN